VYNCFLNGTLHPQKEEVIMGVFEALLAGFTLLALVSLAALAKVDDNTRRELGMPRPLIGESQHPGGPRLADMKDQS